MTPNVNLNGNISNEINVKRLGSQQKEILRYLYQTNKVHQQVEIIQDLYAGVTDSRKASVSRSITSLREKKLVAKQNSLYYPNLEAWCKARPHYGITDKGREFVERDSRFPDIGGESDA